jgi:hypothetical protein
MTKSSDAEMKERKALVGSTTTQTFFSRAEADIGLQSQGRHAAAAKATVTGSQSSVQYPRQPENSPWHSDIVPPEGPLGYSVQDDVEPTGNYHEIEESLLAASVLAFPPDADEAREVDATPPPRAVPTSGFLSPQEVGVASLIRGRRL